MGHELFYELFPEIAEKETRTIIVRGLDTGVPPGIYPVYEYYCTDPDCDCRQVYLHIRNDTTQQVEAIISFGWEPIAFYQKWNYGVLDDQLRDFKGPALGFRMPQGRFAQPWLNYVKHWLKSDKPYVKRLENHYRMVKASLVTKSF
ncbi:MAG: hypothetical protein J7497_17470 [Chitinophagaceae bacterium]|nr:hypothetical protein [Chitinophagaceae bacterium]